MERNLEFIIADENDFLYSSADNTGIESECVKLMLNNLKDFPCQIRDAWRLGADAPIYHNKYSQEITKVLVIGAGNSHLAGFLMKKYAESFAKIPTYAISGYHLPYPDGNTLVLLVSHSGNSSETISCYMEAKKHNARCVVITGGGKLKQMAEENQDVLITIPQNLSAGESMAYLTVPPLLVADSFGLWEIPSGRLLEILESVNDVIFCCNEFVRPEENHAKQLAKKITGKTPVILGVEGCMEAVALSWQNLFNQNAKYPAHANTINNFCYSEIETVNQNNIIIFLRTMCEDSLLRAKISALEQMLNQREIAHETLWLMGKSSLAKAYAMYTFGNYISLYLADFEKKNCLESPWADSIKKLV